MSKILLYGLSSFKNKGCEAIVNTTLKQFNDSDEVAIATFDYDHDKSYFKNRISKYVRHYENDETKFNDKEKKLNDYYKSIPFDYNNFELLYQRKVVDEIKKSDYCIHIGGDNYCYGYNEWLYALNSVAKKYNKKTILWCASLFDHIDDPALIEDLYKYDLIILRELVSYNAVKKYIPEEKLMLAPDPAFALNKAEVNLDEWYKSNKNIIGINISPLVAKNDDDYKIVKEYINYLLKETDLNILLIPHVVSDSSNDMKILERIKNDYKNENRIFLESPDYSCEEIKYIISKCKYIVTARTHASIASYSMNIPTLVIGYSIKSVALSDLLFGSHENTVVDSKHLSLDDLINKTEYLFEHSDELSKILSKKTKKIIEESKNTFKRALDQINTNETNCVVSKEKCVGCMACLNICPHKAISVKKDRFGFEYPVIDKNKCTNCGSCKKVCPALNSNNITNTFKPEFYAATSKEISLKLNSSSGGIFHHIAKSVLDKNGIIYGAEISNLSVKHIRIDNYEELYKIQKSKYVQSSLKDIFKQVSLDLKNNKTVLFSGTPCQISGLKNYLNNDYDNLICVSIVCHGVTSDYILNKNIQDLEKDYAVKISNVDFRYKANGWEDYEIKYIHNNGSLSFNHKIDPVMQLYIKNYNLRESCYDCKFKGLKNNKADLILADYWGIYNHHKDFFDKNGVSAVILLTSKGKKIFNAIKGDVKVIDTKYGYINENNPSLVEPAKKPLNNLYVIEKLNNNSVKCVVENILLDSNLKELKQKEEILNNKISYLEEENKKIYKECIELNELYQNTEEKNKNNEKLLNSKRVKLINKFFSPIDKIRRK